MLSYQQQYLENVRKIAALSDFYGISAPDYESWYEKQLLSRRQIATLREENIALLSGYLFPALDELHTASEADINALEEFAGALMDWSTNLDCGIYLLIHDSLLSLYRFRRDRNRVIKELYMVGMGLYYQSRSLQGIECEALTALRFRNEMVFTEGGSYLKFFSELDDEETKGYIIRSLANIAICSSDLGRRVAISKRVLQIVQDDYYRSRAPSLPWDTFLQRTHMQMSSNRAVLSKGGLSAEELAAVLESCEVVFKPESGTETPNVRWLWPYYEMEYSCGFVDLATTLSRMERLIEDAPYDSYDVSGLYANVQLPIYYGRLVRDNPSLQAKHEHIRFLDRAYRKMMRTLLSCPAESFTDFFFYNICLVVTDYFEIDGVESYRDITTKLMKRLTGHLYIRSRRAGELMRLCSTAIYRSDPAFFDDIGFLRSVPNGAEKEKAVADYAEQCGLYHDFGLIKMNFERLCQTRDLFEGEQRMYELHTISGHDDLAARRSTAIFADAALGHHRWYDGSDGYPADYVRNSSPYRQMTDLVAVVAFINDCDALSPREAVASVIAQEHSRFSPLITAFLSDEALLAGIEEIFRQHDEPYYRELYCGLTGSDSETTN